MEYLQETTDWDCGYNVANHTYLIQAGKMHGYIKAGTDRVILFTKPLFFSKKGRTFKKVKI